MQRLEEIPQAGLILFDRTPRERLLILGPDRAKFLQNLTTQDVQTLKPGQGAEAFITSPQGRALGYVTLHATDDAILLRTDPGGLEHVLPHFQKYGIFDDVSFEPYDKHFPGAQEWHLVGDECRRLLEVAFDDPDDGRLINHASLPDWPVLTIREQLTPAPGVTLLVPGTHAHALSDSLERLAGPSSLVKASPELFELWRIEAGTPVYGQDVTVDNLPQEVDRNTRAINFKKGCYLGQETVARLDALGHVNKLLRGLLLDPIVEPRPGETTLQAEDGKPAGRVTSVAYSPAQGRWIGLGIVRVAHATPGRALTYDVDGQAGQAVVSNFPIVAETS